MHSQKQKLTTIFVAIAVLGIVAIASLVSILNNNTATKQTAQAYNDTCLDINATVGINCLDATSTRGLCAKTPNTGQMYCDSVAPNQSGAYAGYDYCKQAGAFDGQGCNLGDRSGNCARNSINELYCLTEGNNACEENGLMYTGKDCNINGKRGFCSLTYANQKPFCDTSSYITKNANCENLDTSLPIKDNLFTKCYKTGLNLGVVDTTADNVIGFCTVSNNYGTNLAWSCGTKNDIYSLACKYPKVGVIKNPGTKCTASGLRESRYGVCDSAGECIYDTGISGTGSNPSNPVPPSTSRTCSLTDYISNPIGCFCTQINLSKGLIETGTIVNNNGVQSCKTASSDVTPAPGDSKCSVANYISGDSVGCTCISLNSSLQVSVGVIEKQAGVNVCNIDTNTADPTTGPRLCTALDVINAIKDGKDTFYGCKCTTLGTGGFANGTVTKGTGNIPYCKSDADGIDTTKPRKCDLADIAKNPGKAMGCACSTVTGSKKADGIIKLSGGKLVCTKQ